MMKKKTVRLISCIIAGILVAAMVFSMIASGLVYAGAVSSKELKKQAVRSGGSEGIGQGGAG